MFERAADGQIAAESPAMSRWLKLMLRQVLWLGMTLLWVAYGLSLIVTDFVATITAWLLLAAGAFVLARWPLRLPPTAFPACRTSTWLLAAIPLGLILSLAVSMTYVDDYLAYLRLAKDLYTSGGYSDLHHTVAWRPPGMALLYGIPIRLGVSPQASVWLINSGLCLIAYLCVRSLSRACRAREARPSGALAGLVLCLALLPLMLLPIAHLPSIATMLIIVILIPTSAAGLAGTPLISWFVAGALTGVSALFRVNLVLELPILMAALLAAHGISRAVREPGRILVPILACSLGVVVVVAPWTVRNWNTLHRFVPVSTNGGMVFYSANAPKIPSEQGAYHHELYYQIEADVPDEVDRDKEGWRRGWAAIVARPKVFLASFVYRIPKLLQAPTYGVRYINRNGATSPLTRSALVVFRFADLVVFWWLWLSLFQYRHAIRARILDLNNIPWPQWSLLISVAVSLMFECAPTYQLSFLPFIVFTWLDARSHAPAPTSPAPVDVTATIGST
jgi:hypothetical protein